MALGWRSQFEWVQRDTLTGLLDTAGYTPLDIRLARSKNLLRPSPEEVRREALVSAVYVAIAGC